MFVPVYQGLTPLDFARPVRSHAGCFPFDAPRHWYFYRARNAIYHLFRILRESRPALTVLAPDYNSGNEVLAMQAAGVTVRYCPIDRNLQLDPAVVELHCERHNPDVLYVIHYAGWPQPVPALADLCRRRNMLLVEDCALALLSADGSRPLGTIGDWAVFCLYKTLPLPNGALLSQNTPDATVERGLETLSLRSPGVRPAVGRTAELMVQRLRSRADRIGSALDSLKRRAGRAATAFNVRGPNVGDIGFEIDDVDLAMSSVSTQVLRRLDLETIRARRIANYRHLADRMRGAVTPVFESLPDGVCPLFFPVLVPNKHEAALALQARGVDALEFWNGRVDLDGAEPGAAERFFHTHVLELPVHQDLTPRHLDHVARQVRASISGCPMLPIPYTQPDVSRRLVRRSDGAGGSGEAAKADSLRVECITRPEDLAPLRAPWNALLRVSRSDGFFLTWEWLDAWWTHLSGDLALHIVLVWDGDDLVGIAPLARTRTTLPWLSRFEFLGTGFAGSDYLDLIVRRDREPEVAEAIADAFLTSSLALHLDHLPSGSIMESTIVDRVAANAWTSMHTTAGLCPFIPLEGHSWDSYLASLGSAHRANVRRRLRGLDRDFEVRFAPVSDDDARREGLETLMSLHNRRWDTRGGSTAFPTTACRAFHYDITHRALETGSLRLYELRLNDVVAAATYCFAYGGKFYFYQGAFDDRYQQHSVGMAAMGLTIRAAIEEGAREFDMLFGVESYKWLWARHARPLHRIDLFPSDLAGRAHFGTVRAERAARTLARRIFPRSPCTSNVPPAGVVC